MLLTHNLSHNVLSKGVKLKHLDKLPQSGEYYVMKVWNHINAPKVPMMGSLYNDWVVMEETEPKSFLCNCTEMASKTANAYDHAKLLSKVSWIIKKAPVLDITDDDTLFQFPVKHLLCIAVENDGPLSPIAALTLRNRSIHGHKFITCSQCQNQNGQTVEAFSDHKKKLLKWKNDVGVIDIPSKKKVRKGQSKEQDSDDVTDVQ